MRVKGEPENVTKVVFSAGFGCSWLVLGVLDWFLVFSAGFWCFDHFSVILAGFWCSCAVFGVLGRFLVFPAGFGCYLPVLGVLGLAILELLQLCNFFQNFGSILTTKLNERSSP